LLLIDSSFTPAYAAGAWDVRRFRPNTDVEVEAGSRTLGRIRELSGSAKQVESVDA
jgi:hypothetical protein